MKPLYLAEKRRVKPTPITGTLIVELCDGDRFVISPVCQTDEEAEALLSAFIDRIQRGRARE